MPDQHLIALQFFQKRSEDKFQSFTLGQVTLCITEVLTYDEMQRTFCLSLRQISYQKNGGNLNNFYEELDDFNIDALEPNSQVLQVLTKYNQVAKESTQVSGSLLDHMFIRKDIEVDIDVQSIVITTFFFLSGFSFTNIHKSQDCRGRGRAFL